MRSTLVSAQLAVATVVLIAAGLMVRSLGELARVDPGFSAERQLVATVNISSTLYPEREDYLGFYRAYLAELESLPGVESVGAMRYFPTRGVGEAYSWKRPGVEPPADRLQRAQLLQIDAGLPLALGMRLDAGRFLDDADDEGTPGIIVNQALARLAFPGVDAVGETLLVDDDFAMEVVGVVGDIKQRGVAADPDPTIYVSQEWNPRRSMAFVIRTVGDPLELAGAVRGRLRTLDPKQPLAELTTSQQVLSGSLSLPRFLALVSGTFGALATTLAILGVAGMVTHAANMRTREIGIRVALGERPQAVSLRMVRRSFLPVAIGLAVGLFVALGVAGLMRGVLFGVVPHDFAAVLGSLGILVLGSFVACYLPARKASALDPVWAMRSE